jgi:hypothetical protein
VVRWVTQLVEEGGPLWGRELTSVTEILLLADLREAGGTDTIRRSVSDKLVLQGLQMLRAKNIGVQVRIGEQRHRLWSLTRHELLAQLHADALRERFIADRTKHVARDFE